MHVVSLASTCRKENEKNRAANGTRFRVQLHRDYERAILPIATQEMAALPDRRHLFSEKFLCHARNVAPPPPPSNPPPRYVTSRSQNVTLLAGPRVTYFTDVVPAGVPTFVAHPRNHICVCFEKILAQHGLPYIDAYVYYCNNSSSGTALVVMLPRCS